MRTKKGGVPSDSESDDGGDGGESGDGGDGSDDTSPTTAPTSMPTESDSPDDNTEAPVAPGDDGECADPVQEHDQVRTIPRNNSGASRTL